MKILIFEPNTVLGKFLSDYMFSIGIIPMVTEDIHMLLPQLKQGNFDIFLSDYSNNEVAINDLIFNIKLNRNISAIKIFITTPRPEKDVLEKLIKLGISGFIKKPFPEDQFKSAFESWLTRNSFTHEKRKHFRVVPRPSDNAFAVIRTKFRNVDIKFTILDISVGGVALCPPKDFHKLMFKCFVVGDTVKEVRLRIRHFSIHVDIKIVHVEEDRVNFQYVNSNDKSQKYIYRYIADNING